ncbi:TPA: site-specific DNA-methyltransferase [Campylobacter jejuni]|uniref:site-specific DNA-methyltransferase n=1 Tax=Campylobacter jejuni TaxID=197 RepID=UPI00069C9FC6|nr:site-specific DNA-methyltransferase [Campylobacter jejuni]ECL3347061.1 site-specific DNA-methyltransferase [Campylobacter jejuni]HEF4881511.1 site-specific DNA-methyltransferase [Campylobacter jejuni]HEF4897731.1 site-specific DNA-methyltransferase [Campylobacter jejuni]
MNSYYKFIELLKEHYVRFKPKDSNLYNKTNGFDNYLSIKNRHFQTIESFLNTQSVSNDIANKLYDFFSSYLNASGTPFFIKTPLHKNIYAPVYNNSDDVSLFYKTKDLYYVKTDTIYKDIDFEYKNCTIKISAQNLEQKKDNNKNSKEISLELVSIEGNNINFNANFKADSDSNYKAIKKEIDNTLNIIFTENDYKDIKQEFKKQNTIDFFIHKNAEKFLKEQFDLFIYHYFYKDLGVDTQWSNERLEELKNLKLIAYKIIELIAKLENEVLRIWLKPKFVKNLNYVFSLDLLKGLEKEITSDKGFETQLKEWQELGMNYESFDSTLPLDTKHFSPRLREKILSHFDNLNEILNGELIKSDNFNALNTLKNKYRGKVKCIYIDPPYNTTNDDFVYFDKFNHATWLSFMRDRLALAREFLSDDGVIFVSIDDNEQARLKLLMDEIFGEDNFVNNLIWEKKYSPANDAKWFSDNHDFIITYAKNKENFKPILLPRTKEMNARYQNIDNDPRGKWKPGGFSVKTYSANYDYPITTPSGKVVLPPQGGCWQTSEENYKKLLDDNRIYFGKNGDSKPQIKQFLTEVQQGVVVKTLWRFDEVGHNQIGKQEIKTLFNLRSEIFSTPKPEKLLQRIIEISTSENDLVMDFHLGSGTTAAVAHKMNRRYIGVELGEYFYTTTMPRLKKVINAEQGGISKALDFKGGGAFVYYELESYEEALRECEYASDDLSLIDYKKSRKLIKSLDKKEKLYIDLKHEYFKDLDIFVSFANIYGLSIISYKIKNDELYINISDKESYCMKDLDLGTYTKLRDYLWWKSDE